MTQRLACPPAPGPLEDFAARFDELFGTLAQRRGLLALQPQLGLGRLEAAPLLGRPALLGQIG
jgi:hypothetical protein